MTRTSKTVQITPSTTQALAMWDDSGAGLKPMHYIADGDDVALGGTGDAAVLDTGGGSVIAFLRKLRDMFVSGAALFTPKFARPMVFSGNFSLSNTYAAAKLALGTVVEFTGLTAGETYIITAAQFRVSQSGAITAPTFAALFFDDVPSTTFTNNTAVSWQPADAAKVIYSLGVTTQTISIDGYTEYVLSINRPFVANSAGKLYMALVSNGAISLTSASMYYRVSLAR